MEAVLVADTFRRLACVNNEDPFYEEDRAKNRRVELVKMQEGCGRALTAKPFRIRTGR
jgi:hypothetical protein